VYDGRSFGLLNSFQAHNNAINRIKQSPFQNDDLVATCSDDKTVKLWNLTSNWTLIRTYTGHSGGVNGLEWINNDTIASGSWDSTIQMWSIKTGQTLRTIITGSGVYSLKLLANGFHLASCLDYGEIYIHNVNDGSLISTVQAEVYNEVRDLIQINEYLLASSSDDHTVEIWNLRTNSKNLTLTGHSLSVTGLKLISFDILASGSADNTIKLWNLTNGTLIRTLSNHTGDIHYSIDLLSVDNSQTKFLVSGSLDKTIKIWNYATGECLHTVNTNLSIRTLTVLNPTIEKTAETTSKYEIKKINEKL